MWISYKEIQIESMIAHNRVFVENEVMVLIDLLHSLLHPLFELDGKTFAPLQGTPRSTT
jgi:hypothetical protein